MNQGINKKYVTFAVLPYLNLSESITVGNVTFWPFYREQENRIKDINIREHLKKIFSCYVSPHGRTLVGYLRLANDENNELIKKLKDLFRKKETSAQIRSIYNEIPISLPQSIYESNEEINYLKRFLQDPNYFPDINRDNIRIAIEKLRNISVDVTLPPVLDPIEDITIASIGDKSYIEGLAEGNFSEMTEPIRTATNILFFACLERSLQCQGSSSPFDGCTSDNFQIYYQNVSDKEGSNYFAIEDGFWIRNTSYVSCDQTRIITPPYVPSHYQPGYDASLMDALIKASGTNTPECRRIMRSIPPLYYAFRNSPADVDYNTRIFLLAQAFEILLDLEEGKERQDFRAKIHSILGNNHEPKRCYDIILRHKTIKENLTEKQIWAEEFYKLRNKIVHGEEVKPQDYQFTNINGISGDHFPIALQFFTMSLEILLEKANIGYYCPHYFMVSINENKKDDKEEKYTGPFTILYTMQELDRQLKTPLQDTNL